MSSFIQSVRNFAQKLGMTKTETGRIDQNFESLFAKIIGPIDGIDEAKSQK
jgi:hypothetical protein